MQFNHLNASSFLSLVLVEMRFHLIVLRLDSTSLSFRWLRHAHLNSVLAFLAYRFSSDTIDDTYCNSISCLLLAGRQNLLLNLGLSIWMWKNQMWMWIWRMKVQLATRFKPESTFFLGPLLWFQIRLLWFQIRTLLCDLASWLQVLNLNLDLSL